MIKPNELRIGNCILFDNTPDIINMIGDKFASGNKHFNFFYERLQPIPLNTTILEKLGLNEKNNQYIYRVNYVASFYKSPEFSYCLQHYIDDRGDVNYLWKKGILYLHQLQNIHFAWSGKELDLSNLFLLHG